jgi:hypothetical protein
MFFDFDFVAHFNLLPSFFPSCSKVLNAKMKNLKQTNHNFSHAGCELVSPLSGELEGAL